jgi:cell wall assembly regulator SMI1
MTTQQVISACNEILKELSKFSEDILFLGEPITDKRIIEFEKQIGFALPLDFKYLLSIHNSFSLSGTGVLGIGEEFRGASLENVYQFEHKEVGNPMLAEFLPFSPDGAGNHYCLDLSRLNQDLCPVVFWQHDYEYSGKEDVETCNANFFEWIQEVMIDEWLEEINYDGSDKL